METKVQKIIEKMRPYIQMHGGDVALLNIKSDSASTGSGLIVKLKVTGKCAQCSLSHETFDSMLGGMIKEEIPEVKEILIEN